MRGTWFLEQSWEPLDEDLSDRIELEHINKFKDYILNKINNNSKPNNNNNSELDPLLTTSSMNFNLNTENETTTTVETTKPLVKQQPVNERMYLILNF
jgi:hypothetical protein